MDNLYVNERKANKRGSNLIIAPPMHQYEVPFIFEYKEYIYPSSSISEV